MRRVTPEAARGSPEYGQEGARRRPRTGPPTEDQQQPPGLLGVYRLLHDEPLWRALAPLIERLKGFAEGLEKPISNPISDFSGKPGRPS